MYGFNTVTGKVLIDHSKCLECKDKPCIKACIPKLFKEEDCRPVLNMDQAMVKKGRCIECLACELDCHFLGKGALNILLALPETN